jgi:hypothetical protein
MVTKIEAGDGWVLWFRGGMPVVWIRQLNAGWVELRWWTLDGWPSVAPSR